MKTGNRTVRQIQQRAKGFKVQVRGRYRRFTTLDEARAFCNEVHRRTRIVLGIEAE
jgi:hypothetical protein